MQEQILHVYADELEVMQETRKRENTLWHDMKHHIIELKTMLNETKIQDAQNYIKEIYKSMPPCF